MDSALEVMDFVLKMKGFCAAEEEAAWFRLKWEEYLEQMESFSKTLLTVMEVRPGAQTQLKLIISE